MKTIKLAAAFLLALSFMATVSLAEGEKPLAETVSGEIITEEPVGDIAEPEEKTELVSQNQVLFHAEIKSDEVKARYFIFELYSSDGQTLIERRCVTTEEWATSFNMTFDVPKYNIGEKFILKLISDNGEISFNSEKGKEFILETYLTADGEGKPLYQTAFYGEITPAFDKPVKIIVEGNEAEVDYRVFGNEVYVSEDLIKELSINLSKEDESWFLTSHTEGFSMRFFAGNIYALKNGAGYNLKYPVYEEEGKAYLPLYDIAVYFACSLTDEETENERILSLEYSHYGIVHAKEKIVNESGVESKTDYLIWISKNDHTVNVFTGKKGFWHLYKSYPCALGAPRTPTIEGQFEYIERLNRWTYPSYYCGPVMRFHNGYALHSTLIRYDGTPYDDRVGVDISLGCIRLHPADINELIGMIPFKTRIYITK